MGADATSLHSERAGLRGHVFNVLLILVMKISFLTYFVLTPWLNTMASDLSVSAQASTLVAVVYECGKFAGTVFFGRLGTTHNILLCTLGAMLVYAVNAVLLTGYLNSGWRTHGCFDFVCFLLFYFPLSAVCMAPQFGLAILKKTNSALRCKRYVMLQGLMACVLQGCSVPLGETVGQALGWKTEFLVLAAFMGLVAACVYAVATPAHVAACQPQPPQQKAEELLRSEGQQAEELRESYWSLVRDLVLSARQRPFQVWCFALGVATANMYLLPMYGMMLLEGSGGGSVSKPEAAHVVGATFIGNFVARVTGLLLASRISGESFVRAGMVLMVLGSSIAVVLGALPAATAPSLVLTFTVAGSVVQAGVGLVMPNCKAGALFAVPDSSASTANSLLKLSQLIFTAVVQALATSAGCSVYFERFALLLLLWSSAGALGLFWWERSQRRPPTLPRPMAPFYARQLPLL